MALFLLFPWFGIFSFNLIEYLKVFIVWFALWFDGETHDIIIILHKSALPRKESLKTKVNLEFLKGTCCSVFPFFLASKALIHSLSANNDLLISAPSANLLLSFDCVSVARSLPAKSTKDNLA